MYYNPSNNWQWLQQYCNLSSDSYCTVTVLLTGTVTKQLSTITLLLIVILTVLKPWTNGNCNKIVLPEQWNKIITTFLLCDFYVI